MNNTNLFGQSTSLNQNRFGSHDLFGNTESLSGLDKLKKSDIQTASNVTSLFDANLPSSTAMTFTFGDNQPSIPVTSTFLSTTPLTFSLSKPPITTTTLPTLFSTMSQPSNNELAFLGRNMKPNVNLNRTKLYSTVLPQPRPYVLSSKKRKFNDDDDDDALLSPSKHSKMNIKRPRMLDMNKIRSIILGNNETYLSLEKKSDQRSFSLPRLTHHDYYTKPKIEELNGCFDEQGQCLVKEFTITRKHYGSVTFQGSKMNLAGLDLDRLVEIDRRQVTVYPDEKDRPSEGEELNCQAIISLIGVYPIDRSIAHGSEEVTDPERLIEMNYGKHLEGMTRKFQGHFLNYDVHTGTWTFQIEHF